LKTSIVGSWSDFCILSIYSEKGSWCFNHMSLWMVTEIWNWADFVYWDCNCRQSANWFTQIHPSVFRLAILITSFSLNFHNFFNTSATSENWEWSTIPFSMTASVFCSHCVLSTMTKKKNALKNSMPNDHIVISDHMSLDSISPVNGR
jgi:hypothetical protein